MKRSDKPAASRREAISLEWDLKHPPEKVWRALTTPELLAEWLLPVTGFRLEPGADFTFKAPEFPDWDGTVSCRLIESEPHRKLSYSWTLPFLDTVVTFTLTPTALGTRLCVVQSGFEPDQKQAAGGARYGWKMMGGKLIDVLDEMP
jgi:uncharacterized protein YndB with AHSA1/START domain